MKRGLIGQIEALSIEGLTDSAIATRLRCSVEYVTYRRQVLRAESRGSAEPVNDDVAHIARVMAQGGFPTAVTLRSGSTVHIGPDGLPWRFRGRAA